MNQVLKHTARLVMLAFAINAVLALAKGTAGAIGNSFALVADAIESGGDLVTGLVVWAGLRYAAKPPDDNHPYGHGKAEPLASVVVSAALLLSAAIIVYQSIKHILTPHALPEPFTIFVLIGVVAIKETMYRIVHRAGKKIGSGAVMLDAWHHRGDAITSLAVFFGILIALYFGPGYEAADDWAALVAAGVIAYNAYRLGRPAIDELTDVAPDPAIEAAVRQAAENVPGVLGTDKCFVRKMGLDYYVDLHVEVDGSLSVSSGHQIAHDVKDAIRAAQPRVVEALIHIEPFDEA
ncbi:MAG: cation transporter [Armatimonadetes bacterium]|nr:cation transporter [Armatimonadota bacterium]